MLSVSRRGCLCIQLILDTVSVSPSFPDEGTIVCCYFVLYIDALDKKGLL